LSVLVVAVVPVVVELVVFSKEQIMKLTQPITMSSLSVLVVRAVAEDLAALRLMQLMVKTLPSEQ
jgi:hypothetical protein